MRVRLVSGAGSFALIGTLGCARAAEERTSLAEAASYTRVELVADDGRIRATLRSTHGACLQIDATATIGGLPMVVEERGQATTGAGTGLGEVRTTCTPPSFVLARSPGSPELPAPVTLAITDASRTYELRLTDGLPRRPYTISDPPDGKLHPGKSATLSIPIGSSTPSHLGDLFVGETAVECADVAGHSLFKVTTQPFPGQTPQLRLANGDFTFDVPASSKPQVIQIGLAWHLALMVESCVGPLGCSAREDHAGGGGPGSSFEPDEPASGQHPSIEP